MHWIATQANEKLDRLYYCQSCGRAFLFREDKEDHKLESGHSSFIIHNLEGTLSDTN